MVFDEDIFDDASNPHRKNDQYVFKKFGAIMLSFLDI